MENDFFRLTQILREINDISSSLNPFRVFRRSNGKLPSFQEWGQPPIFMRIFVWWIGAYVPTTRRPLPGWIRTTDFTYHWLKAGLGAVTIHIILLKHLLFNDMYVCCVPKSTMILDLKCSQMQKCFCLIIFVNSLQRPATRVILLACRYEKRSYAFFWSY